MVIGNLTLSILSDIIDRMNTRIEFIYNSSCSCNANLLNKISNSFSGNGCTQSTTGGGSLCEYPLSHTPHPKPPFKQFRTTPQKCEIALRSLSNLQRERRGCNGGYFALPVSINFISGIKGA